MKNRSRLTIFATMLSVLACLGLAFGAEDTPNAFGPGGNTWDGQNALLHRTTGGFNSAFGWYSLFSLTTASYDVGVGAGALAVDNGGTNTAVGTAALLLNTTGSANNAVGFEALLNNSSGDFNNAHGREALFNNTGDENNAFGDFAMLDNTSGSHNTAMGDDALESCTTGSSNVAIGDEAGTNVVTGDGNIYVGAGAQGPGDEIRFVRIGDSSFTDYDCFIVGIKNREVDAATASLVLVDANQKVGTVPIDAAGHPVKFQAMLDDALKQQTRIAELEGTVARLAAMVKEQAAQIQKVSAQLEMSKPAAKVVVNKP